jgi:hypothetical protein
MDYRGKDAVLVTGAVALGDEQFLLPGPLNTFSYQKI